MKKRMYILLSVITIVVFSFTTVFADKGGNKNSGRGETGKQVTEDKKIKEAVKNADIEDLKNILKEVHKNREQRKELIREIVRLRKDKNDHSMPVFIKGTVLETDVPPVIKSGRMLIPVRAVTNSLGAEVGWDGTTRTATITKTVTYGAGGEKTITIVIKLDSDVVLVDGQEVKIDVPAELISSRTFVPLRFIAETFKQKVEWDEETGSVIIEDEEEATPEPTPVPTPEATPTPEPEATPIPEPEATPAPEPEATPTPEPEATPAPEPEATSTPGPEATPAPVPEATPAPEPEATPAPEPEATPTPVPEVTPSSGSVQ